MSIMSTFIRQWQKYIIGLQARLGLHTSKLKYSKTHEKVIKRNKNCQSMGKDGCKMLQKTFKLLPFLFYALPAHLSL